MRSHHVPNEFPRCFPNSQWVLQDVFKSTSLLSHINLCPKLSFWNLHRQAKEGTAIFLPWDWKLIFGSVSKVSFIIIIFLSFWLSANHRGPVKKNKIWTWEAPTTKCSLSCVNGMSAHLSEKWLLKYQIHQICRLYQNCPFCG